MWEDMAKNTRIEVSTLKDILALLGDAPKGMSYDQRGHGKEHGKGQYGPSLRLSVEDELLLTIIKL